MNEYGEVTCVFISEKKKQHYSSDLMQLGDNILSSKPSSLCTNNTLQS